MVGQGGAFGPVAIQKAGIDVVRAFHTTDGLQTHSGQLIGHDIHQAVFELVARQVGTNEARCVGLGVGQ